MKAAVFLTRNIALSCIYQIFLTTSINSLFIISSCMVHTGCIKKSYWMWYWLLAYGYPSGLLYSTRQICRREWNDNICQTTKRFRKHQWQWRPAWASFAGVARAENCHIFCGCFIFRGEVCERWVYCEGTVTWIPASDIYSFFRKLSKIFEKWAVKPNIFGPTLPFSVWMCLHVVYWEGYYLGGVLLEV